MREKGFENAIVIDKLTDSQKEAVFHKDGALLVLAGPGSGKTRVITSRIAALINSGVWPGNICAITFTNKAAEEMKERVLASGVPSGAQVSTFHSLCVRILRQYADRVNIKANFSIYDQNDQRRLMKEALKRCQLDTSGFSPVKMLDAVGRSKNRLESVVELSGRADDYFTKVLANVYGAYQRLLKSNNAVDFDDLLVFTAILLREDEQVRGELSGRFRYLLVDEYQDTNHAQYEIARQLAEHGNICVTGDPDQSIYRWRGADISNIMAFEKDWPDAKVVKLEENFRSTPNILQVADVLIAGNKNRKDKKLVAVRDCGVDVEMQAYSDERDEAEGTASRIVNMLEDGVDLNEIAVFYRVNSMSRALEEALVSHQVPYQVVRGVEFYSRAEIRDMLGYLKVIANPADDLAFLRALNSHPRGIGKTTVGRISRYANEHLLSLYDAAGQAVEIETISRAVSERLRGFQVFFEKLRGMANGPVSELMEKVFSESGYLEHLQKGGEKEDAAIENIDELINAAARYDEINENPNLADYLESVALFSDSDTYQADSGKVSLMSLHAAKGLEFETVFIVGLEDGLLPHERSRDVDDELEEERRLLFVGITRGKDRVCLSYSRHRTMHGQFLRTVPSQFLYEMGYKPEREFGFDDSGDDGGGDDDYYYDSSDSQVTDEKVFKVNELVGHKKFGTGRVREFINLGENSIVVVRFNSGKTKSLMVKYANLTRCDYD